MEKEIGTVIRNVNHDIKVFLDRYMSLHLPNHLTGIEGLVVGYISTHGSLYASDIMENFHFQKATVSQAIAKLVRKGYLSVKLDPKDKRKKIILLTELGKKANEEFEDLYKTLVPTIEKGISEEDKLTFLRVCEQVKKNVGGNYEQNQK